jgi:cytoskeletal protein CcmA (bactofilin family)
MMATRATLYEQGVTVPTEARGEESIIARGDVVDGVLRTARPLRIAGQAKGQLYCDGTLVIEEGAQVDARVVAGQLTVAGTLTGDITCHGKLQILPTGRVAGHTVTATLVIQEGAVYEGDLRMVDREEAPAPDGDAPVEVVQFRPVGQGAAAGMAV